MYDAGEKMSDSMDMEMPSESKNKVYYPHLDFDLKQFPEISKMDVGKTYMLEMEVKVTRKSESETETTSPKASLCCEVRKVGMADDQNEPADKKVDNLVEKMYPKKDEKKMADMKK
jgi:hypothetical protein